MRSRNVATFFLLGLISVDAASESLTYALSQDCLERIDIDRSDAPNSWAITMKARIDESARFEAFTRQHVGREMMVVSGEGVPLMSEAATIQAPMSDRFRLVVLSEEDAERALSLLTVGGKCGPGA